MEMPPNHREIVPRFCFAVFVFSSVVGGLVPVPAAASAPTFTQQAAPILFKRCVDCHRPGQIGASLPLDSYDAAKRSAAAIKAQVVCRAMPPWSADPAHSLPFRNDPRLSTEEIDTLVAWVDAGAVKGPDVDLPALPQASSAGWRHPRGVPPDAIISLPEFTVKANDVVPYVQLLVKVPVQQDRWITAMQVRPGNPVLVHHVGIAEVALADGVAPKDLQALDTLARQLGMPSGAALMSRPAVVDPDHSTTYDMLGVYTPGTTFETYGDGNAKLLKGGANMYINFNMHYTATAKVEKDRTQLALWFQSQPPRHVLYRVPASGKTILSNGRQLLTDDAGTKAEGTDVAIPPIPPYAADYTLVGVTGYTRPVTLFQFQPHAHLRAKDFTYVVVYPDGREVTALTVPKYDFHWQLAYELQTPLKLPAGSKLVVTVHYDNSTSNQHLREAAATDPTRNCGPDKAVFFRDENQSWDEMFSPILQYSLDDGPSRQPGAIRSAASHALKIDSAVGCLAQDRAGAWTLNRAADAGATDSQSTSRSELTADGAKAAGSLRYRLLGVGVFDPQRYAGTRVAAKGVLVNGSGEMRLNTTSLQPLNARCD